MLECNLSARRTLSLGELYHKGPPGRAGSPATPSSGPLYRDSHFERELRLPAMANAPAIEPAEERAYHAGSGIGSDGAYPGTDTGCWDADHTTGGPR